MARFLFFITSTIFTKLVQALLPILGQTYPIHVKTCRSYCGNLTVDYPFGIRPGCGHPVFRDLLFCINDFLMLHKRSGSYRVLDIDYPHKALTLHEGYSHRALTLHNPHISNCDLIVLGYRGNGFVVDPWRDSYLSPAQDNVFVLIGCSGGSPLFQGFPGKHLPCRNVSSMGCEDYYGCPTWKVIGPKRVGLVYRGIAVHIVLHRSRWPGRAGGPMGYESRTLCRGTRPSVGSAKTPEAHVGTILMVSRRIHDFCDCLDDILLKLTEALTAADIFGNP
ncbi:Wall-associated receptor kinase [Actinidia chinensis var. chinensis]|uniref:Wall-associated receptor kinase n=1 Tax=Actinidia chinensis var. chinensis TaxID=1590841 RepID=A0A2R6QGM7_ACTCC|nr:Wall-associated receptor kinase [Actinidia chinensis var. chinensis]